MSACFYDDEEIEVVRQDVICLAVIYMYPDTATTIPDSFVVPMVVDQEGNIYDPCGQDDFLGIECSGKELDWEDKIREMVEEVENENCKKYRGIN